MPDDVFTKLPKFGKINFVTTKVHSQVNVKHTVYIRVSDKLVLFCQSNSRLKNFFCYFTLKWSKVTRKNNPDSFPNVWSKSLIHTVPGLLLCECLCCVRRCCCCCCWCGRSGYGLSVLRQYGKNCRNVGCDPMFKLIELSEIESKQIELSGIWN